MSDILIGPGPTDYGDLCLECGTRRSRGPHKTSCSRAVDACRRKQHDQCYLDNCGCICHPDLTPGERHALRQFLKERQ